MEECDKGPILDHHSKMLDKISRSVDEIVIVSKQTAVQQEQINNINLRLQSQANDIKDIKSEDKELHNAIWKEIRDIKNLPLRVALSVFTGVAVMVLGTAILYLTGYAN